MDNGITITTDRSGYVYDFGHYAFPSKVTLKGGQYFVEEGGILATVDEKGLFYRKYELIPDKIKGKGINYFLSDEGTLYTVSKTGFVTLMESEVFQKSVNFGGNYFTVDLDPEKKMLELRVINGSGAVVAPEVPNLKIKDIISFGGNYFMTNRGIVYSVSETGEVMPHEDMRIGILAKKGGNYFVDSSGYLYTVSESGTLKMPNLPLNLRVSSIHKLGSNYFIDLSGKLFVVDKEGNVFERVMRDHDFKNAKIISL